MLSLQRIALCATVCALAACSNGARTRGPNGGGVGGGGSGGNGDITGCVYPGQNGFDYDVDQDHDGYTPNAGDCDDCNPTINPGALEIAGNGVDDDCNGQTDEAPATCEPMKYAKDPSSLAHAFEQCDPRFFKSATMNGPSDAQARSVVTAYGVIMPKSGGTMIAMSSGVAAAESDPGYAIPQSGTDLGNTYMNPLPNVPGKSGCSQSQPDQVNDYSELILKLKAPTNANSFSFNFYFMSAEYPEFVCTEFNDEFLVLQESPGEFSTATNIAFDMQMNPVTINNGFFTVCQNGGTSYTNNCTQPVSQLSGTGYELDSGDGSPIGGGTGWLTTTAPVTPGEDVTLHFIVFDEGDGILDSAVLIDNFQWLTSSVGSPTTIQ